MNPTPYADINQLLQELLAGIQAVLGDELVGLYLYGSLVWGDFDYQISDIDLLAALAADLDEREGEALKQMHANLARRFPAWDDRIEVQYYSCLGLKTFKTQARRMGNISPGEPFHLIEAGNEWLMNWYFVQDYGLTLFGPPPQTLIDPLTTADFRQAVYDSVVYWRDHVRATQDSAPYQTYAVLTLCRALYSWRNDEQVSKDRAARWTAEHLPEWSELIHNALIWRKDPENNPATYPETERFVNDMINLIVDEA